MRFATPGKFGPARKKGEPKLSRKVSPLRLNVLTARKFFCLRPERRQGASAPAPCPEQVHSDLLGVGGSVSRSDAREPTPLLFELSLTDRTVLPIFVSGNNIVTAITAPPRVGRNVEWFQPRFHLSKLRSKRFHRTFFPFALIPNHFRPTLFRRRSGLNWRGRTPCTFSRNGKRDLLNYSRTCRRRCCTSCRCRCAPACSCHIRRKLHLHSPAFSPWPVHRG
ncbi:hypothetical protein SAMN05444149_101410 [Pseudosulfitobacter pseudonitzschiae]|nr:hypothetical protein SAMN05444149_101410 [Pseudosulfitobacter pseudonitzschiae]